MTSIVLFIIALFIFVAIQFVDLKRTTDKVYELEYELTKMELNALELTQRVKALEQDYERRQGDGR